MLFVWLLGNLVALPSQAVAYNFCNFHCKKNSKWFHLKHLNQTDPNKWKKQLHYSQYLLQTPQTNHDLNLKANHSLHEHNLNHLKQSPLWYHISVIIWIFINCNDVIIVSISCSQSKMRYGDFFILLSFGNITKTTNFLYCEKITEKPPSAWAAKLSATTLDKVPLKWSSNPSKCTETPLISIFQVPNYRRIKRRYPYFATNEVGDKRIRWMSLKGSRMQIWKSANIFVFIWK